MSNDRNGRKEIKHDWYRMNPSRENIIIEWCYKTSKVRVKRKDDCAWIVSESSVGAGNALSLGERMMESAKKQLLTGRSMSVDRVYFDSGKIL